MRDTNGKPLTKTMVINLHIDTRSRLQEEYLVILIIRILSAIFTIYSHVCLTVPLLWKAGKWKVLYLT